MFCTNECGTVFDRPPIAIYAADDIVGNAYWGYYCSHACALQDMGGALLHYADGPSEGTTGPFDGLIEDTAVASAVPMSDVLDELAEDTQPASVDLIAVLYKRSRDTTINLANYLLDSLEEISLVDETNLDHTTPAGNPVQIIKIRFKSNLGPLEFELYHSSATIHLLCEERSINWGWDVSDFGEGTNTNIMFSIGESVKKLTSQDALL